MANIGRPTKWTDDMPDRVLAYYKLCLEDKEKFPMVSEMCTLLDITRETLDRWLDDETTPDSFYDTYKKLYQLQETRLLERGFEMKNPTFSIFLLKANHRMRETQNIDVTSKDKELGAGIFVSDFKKNED
jgi:hypothetical protein